MIIDKNRKFTTTKGGSFTFTSTNSLIQFSNQTGTVADNGEIVTDIIYPSTDSISASSVFLTIVHRDGCPATVFSVNLVNPCSMVVSDITFQRVNNTFQLLTNVSQGSGDFEFQWSYPTYLYQSVLPVSTNKLVLVPFTKPFAFTATVKVIDRVSNCSVTKSINVPVLNVTPPDITVFLDCILDVNYKHYGSVNLELEHYSIVESFMAVFGTTPDWNTLQITIANNNFTAEANSNSSINIFSGIGVVEGSYTNVMQYSVSDAFGNTSLNGNINIVTNACGGLQGDVVVVNKAVRISPDIEIGDTLTINIRDLVFSKNEIDWDTFNIDNTPSYGTVVLDKDYNLRYTFTSVQAAAVDFIDFSIADIYGNYSSLATIVINHISVARPIVPNQSFAVIVGTLSDEVDITDGTTGEIDLNSVMITTSNPNVRIYKNEANLYSFLVNPAITSDIVLRYKVANYEGYYSEEGVITLTVVSAGNSTDTNITVLSKTFNLINLFNNYTDGTRVWTEVTSSLQGSTASNQSYTDQSGVITGSNGAVDFSSIAPGTYVFLLEVTEDGVTDEEEVVVVLEEIPSITITNTIDNGNGTFTVLYDAVNVTGIAFTVTNNPATYVSAPTLINGSGRATIYFITANGDDIVTITGYTNYQTTVSDTETVTNSNGVVL